MTIDMQTIMNGVTVLLVGGAIMAAIKHAGNDNVHPKKEEIVFKDVCDKSMDCVETEIKSLCEKVDSSNEGIASLGEKFDKLQDYLMKKH